MKTPAEVESSSAVATRRRDDGELEQSNRQGVCQMGTHARSPKGRGASGPGVNLLRLKDFATQDGS